MSKKEFTNYQKYNGLKKLINARLKARNNAQDPETADKVLKDYGEVELSTQLRSPIEIAVMIQADFGAFLKWLNRHYSDGRQPKKHKRNGRRFS